MNQEVVTPEARLEALGYKREDFRDWPYRHFGPFSERGSGDIDFSGIPGIGEDGAPLRDSYLKDGALPDEVIAAAGKRALAKALWALSESGRKLSDYRLHKLEVLIGISSFGSPGLGLVANHLSEMLLHVFGVSLEDGDIEEKGVRATYGVSMEFAIEPILFLNLRDDDELEH